MLLPNSHAFLRDFVVHLTDRGRARGVARVPSENGASHLLGQFGRRHNRGWFLESEPAGLKNETNMEVPKAVFPHMAT